MPKRARFTALSEAEWQAIRSTRNNWPEGVEWPREIERIGRDYWEAQDMRKMWLKKLQREQPTKQRKKIDQALVSIRRARKALAALADDGLLENDFPHPDLDSPEQQLEDWLSDYDIWVKPFAGKGNPLQAEVEWQLIELWKRSGGKVAYSRKKEKGPFGRGRATARNDRQDHGDAERPNTPYAPLVDFLKLTLSAILGKTYRPSGIAKMIDRHRDYRGRSHPYLFQLMRLRIAGILVAAPALEPDNG
jgi:hypothetical protein